MNIFWLDKNPEVNVKYYLDKHVVKMITEYAQLLSTACRLSGVPCGYKVSHIKHPCAIWVRSSLSNWRYLKELSSYLHEEYKYRYGINKTHKAYSVILNLKEPMIIDKGFTTPPQCMPFTYKGEDYIIAYRNYYIGEKAYIAKWTGREVPSWFNFNGVLIPNKNTSNKENYKIMLNSMHTLLLQNNANKLDYTKLEELTKDNDFIVKYCVHLANKAKMDATVTYVLLKNLNWVQYLSIIELSFLYRVKNFITLEEFKKYSESLINLDQPIGELFVGILESKGVEFPSDILERNLMRTVFQSIKNRDFLPITQSIYCYKKDIIFKYISDSVYHIN